MIFITVLAICANLLIGAVPHLPCADVNEDANITEYPDTDSSVHQPGRGGFPPNITVNGPPETGNFSQANRNIVLNATVTDPENDTMTVKFFAGDSPDVSEENGLVYQEDDVTSGETLTYNINALPVAPEPSTVLLYHFDNRSKYGKNGNQVNDHSGNGNDGTIFGEAQFHQSRGKFGGAYDFDRIDDYIEVPHHPSFNTVNRSVEAWIRIEQIDHIGYIAARAGWGTNESYLRLQYSWGWVNAWIGNGASQPSASYQLPVDTFMGKWHHVAATYDNRTLRLYYDGEERANTTVKNGVTALARPWTIGKSNNWFGDLFRGSIDEVAVHGRALSATEIRDHYRLKSGTYHWFASASDGVNEKRSGIRKFTIDEKIYDVRMSRPTHAVTNATSNTTYVIEITNTGEVCDDYSIFMDNRDNASVAEISHVNIDDLGPGSSMNITLTVGDPTPGRYGVRVTVRSNKNLGSVDSVDLITNSILETMSIGTYGICDNWHGLGDYAAGIEKIKSIGGSVIVLSVGTGTVTFPSAYLPKASWASDGMVRNIVDYAHSQGMKIYAWMGMPHSYWLEPERYPEWLSMYSNGTPCQYPIVPPPRVLATPEYLAQMKGVIRELVELGFDAIDINDNFDFITDTSYDNFTVNLFENETGSPVPGNNISQRAQCIKNNQTIADKWYSWRAQKVTQLLTLLQQYVRDAGSDIPLRPHLLDHDVTYWENGHSWQGIAGAVDVCYVMCAYGEERIKKVLGRYWEAGAKEIATSMYLTNVVKGDEKWLGENFTWVRDSGGSEINIFTYQAAQDKDLWDTLRKAVDIANNGTDPMMTVGDPYIQDGDSSVYVKSSTGFNLSLENAKNRSGSIMYRVDEGRWSLFKGNFSVKEPGAHTISYYATDHIVWEDAQLYCDIFVDDEGPESTLTMGRPRFDGDPVQVTRETEFNLSAADGGVGTAVIRYKIDGGEWNEYGGNFTLDRNCTCTIFYYSVDRLGNNETVRSLEVYVDEEGPMSVLDIGEPKWGSDPVYVTSHTEFNLSAADDGNGNISTFYRIDSGNWERYGGNISVAVPGAHTILYYSEDLFGNNETVRSCQIFVDDDPPDSTIIAGGPSCGESPTLVTSDTEFIITTSDNGSGVSSLSFSIDDGAWQEYSGNITVKGSGNHSIRYRSTDNLGNNETVRRFNVSVDDDPPITHLSIGEIRNGSDPVYVKSKTGFNLTAKDDAAGTGMTLYRIVEDETGWLNYTGNFSINGSGELSIHYYSVDKLNNNETVRSCRIFVDDEGPHVWAVPGNLSTGKIEVEAGGRIELFSNDTGVGGEIIYYNLDRGDVWHKFEEPIIIRNDTVIEYYAVDALGNRGKVDILNVTVSRNGTLPEDDEEEDDDDILFPVLIVLIVAVVLIVLLLLYGRKRDALRKIMGFEEKKEEEEAAAGDVGQEVGGSEEEEVGSMDGGKEASGEEEEGIGTVEEMEASGDEGDRIGGEEDVETSEAGGDEAEGEGSLDREVSESNSL